MPEPPGLVACFHDVAVMREAIEQSGGHLGVAKDLTPLPEDALGRMWRKQSKIEAHLGDYWQRPTGMRLATYERLMAEIIDCEEKREEGLAGFLVKLGLSRERHRSVLGRSVG